MNIEKRRRAVFKRMKKRKRRKEGVGALSYASQKLPKGFSVVSKIAFCGEIRRISHITCVCIKLIR